MLRTWMFNNNPVEWDDQAPMKRVKDLVSLRRAREANFNDLVADKLIAMGMRLSFVSFSTITRALFVTEDQLRRPFGITDLSPEGAAKPNLYLSPRQIEKSTDIIIAITVLGLLVAPILIMYKLSYMESTRASYASIAVLLVFAAVFAGITKLLTNAKRQELFAGCAAYAAVLVVFIRSDNQ